MDLPFIDDRVGWFSQVKSHISTIYIRLEWMINSLLLYYTSLIFHNMFIRPYAIVSFNRIVSEIDESFWSHVRTKENIAHIFEIILLIVLFCRIYLRICKVESEVERIKILIKIWLDLFRWGAGTRRICVVVTSRSSNNIERIWVRRVLSIEVQCCIHRRT